MMANIFDTLSERGFVKNCTDPEGLKEALSKEGQTFYIGFDPTGDCLHIGHLLPVMCMAWLQRAGHRPIIVLGGGTAMVGDPSGKDKTREMLTPAKVQRNLEAMRPYFGRIIDMEKAEIVNNADWLLGLGYIGFLRDIGRHFSVNTMIKAEAARIRLERNQGYSFIEFNYHLLQSYDFLHLYRDKGCTIQVGGDDQWFHFCGGIELIRRETGGQAYAFTIPLLARADGKKMGKTEKGAVWIDAERVSPYDYYQYWINVQDADAIKLMKLYTFMDIEEIAVYESMQGAELRKAKQKLAFEATAIVHGQEEARKAEEAARAAFSGSECQDMPCHSTDLPKPVVNLLADSGLCRSRSEARRQIKGGAIKLDYGEGKEKVSDIDAALERPAVLWAGKKRCIRITSVGP
jgi:tyrosyl-tRNA synthetase